MSHRLKSFTRALSRRAAAAALPCVVWLGATGFVSAANADAGAWRAAAPLVEPQWAATTLRATTVSATAVRAAPAPQVDPRLQARYTVSVAAHDLRDVVEQFARALNVTPQISALVSGRVDAAFERATAEEILDSLARSYGFDWWLDGETLRVTDRSERVSRLLSLEGVRIEEIEAAMRALGLWRSKFPIANDGARIAYLTAPPSYAALVELVVADLAEKRVLEAAAFRAAEQARAEERARRLQAYEARRTAEAAELARLREEYESRRQDAIRRIEEAARLRTLLDSQGPRIVRGAGG